MVCSICQESYFKLPARRRGGGRPTNAGRGGGVAHRPAALGCGHAFHKRCIETWFESDTTRSCPQCKVSHHGPVTVLYIDIDEEDCEASRRVRDGSGAQSSGSRSEGDMKQLAQQMLSMSIHDKSAEYFMIAGLLEQLNELKNGSFRSQRLEDELDDARLEALFERGRASEAEAARDELERELEIKASSLQYFRDEVDRLNTLSDRHRDHINSLNRNVESKKVIIRDLMSDMESDKDKIEKYESMYGEIW
ncbi:hypothetical protein GGF42_003664 [Coemansia sp. RSA 2424]|nr:hypothetical protein GGF42_003664 [Coemansia sp. RSA 2424]